MNLQTYTDPGQYLRLAQPMLEARETQNGLILGVTLRLRDQPEWMDTQPYLATIVDDAGRLLLAAAMTPPFNLLVAAEPDVPQAALDLLVGHLLLSDWTVPGVNAENALAERIAQTWSRKTRQPAQVEVRERIYELREVIPPPNPPPGSLRLATMADLEITAAWREAFMLEALHEALPNSQALTARNIRSSTLFIWDDNGPVAMAARTRPTPHGESVGLVYTPPEQRGRGYASACVAALSQLILDSGKAYCSLFTDLDYPTSNSIYQKIGYRPVCDFLSYKFV